MAEKYIVEVSAYNGVFERDRMGHVCKSIHPVVYENKTYWYCKVYGADELKRFLKYDADKFTRHSRKFIFEVQKKNCTIEYIDEVINQKIGYTAQYIIEGLDKEIVNMRNNLNKVVVEKCRLEREIANLIEKKRQFIESMKQGDDANETKE